MQKCERRNKDCSGRITWEHVWIYAGKQINEDWAIIALCEYHHLYEGLDKSINMHISLQYSSVLGLLKYPKKDWQTIKKLLNQKYGT